MGRMVVTFPILIFWFIPTPFLWLSYSGTPWNESFRCLLRSRYPLVCASSHPLVIRCLRVLAALVTPSGIPWFHNDVTHFVVVDPLKQPLASKSDRRPVGTLQSAYNRVMRLVENF
jgi:hypothetical protein